MPLFVQKYGGTSVADVARLRAVAARVAECRARGEEVVVVVSAMAGETDRLLALCAQMGGGNGHAVRESDMVVSTGEQITAGLLAMELQRIGVPACSLTGGQIGIRTDTAYGRARIMDIRTEALREALASGQVVVAPGFQGRTATGDIATLGRGGSDTTAVALAAALSARECQIFTDVDGIYTTDPRVCPKARRLRAIHMEEMLEMSSLGSKVLQLRSVEFAGKYQVPLRVLSAAATRTDDGTLIIYEEQGMEHPLVTGVAFHRAEAKITVAGVPDTPGIAHRLVAAVAAGNINVDMIVQNIGSNGRTDFSFTVHRDDFAAAMAIMKTAAAEIGAQSVLGDDSIGKVSIVGIGMRSHAGVASRMFEALSQADINIQMISTSEIKVSVVLQEDRLEDAVRVLHDAFELDKPAHEETQ